MIDQARLTAVLHYDAATGEFRWIGARHGVKPGRKVGHRCAHGYVSIRIDGKPYYAHRLAWLYVTGQWPIDQIDHRNGARSDNRFENLRLAGNGENAVNRPRRRDNSSGFKGVYRSRSGRFTTQMTVNGKAVHLGTFDTAEEASAFRNRVAEQTYGEFYRSK